MSYYCADADGYIGDIASGGGLHAFVAWAPETGPIGEFLETGWTDDPKALAAALEKEKASDPKVDGTRALLAEYARKADEVLILSDGAREEGAEVADES